MVVWWFGAVTADSDEGDEHPRVTTLPSRTTGSKSLLMLLIELSFNST
jgi:hypothetical protein